MEIDIPSAKISIGFLARICAFSTTLECALSLGRVLSAPTLWWLQALFPDIG